MAIPLDESRLRAALAHAIRPSDDAFVAPSDGSLRARRTERLGAIVLSSIAAPAPAAGSAHAKSLLMSALRERGLSRGLFGGRTDHAALELIARVRLLRTLDPAAGWPEWSEASLLNDACDG